MWILPCSTGREWSLRVIRLGWKPFHIYLFTVFHIVSAVVFVIFIIFVTRYLYIPRIQNPIIPVHVIILLVYKGIWRLLFKRGFRQVLERTNRRIQSFVYLFLYFLCDAWGGWVCCTCFVCCDGMRWDEMWYNVTCCAVLWCIVMWFHAICDISIFVFFLFFCARFTTTRVPAWGWPCTTPTRCGEECRWRRASLV